MTKKKLFGLFDKLKNPDCVKLVEWRGNFWSTSVYKSIYVACKVPQEKSAEAGIYIRPGKPNEVYIEGMRFKKFGEVDHNRDDRRVLKYNKWLEEYKTKLI